MSSRALGFACLVIGAVATGCGGTAPLKEDAARSFDGSPGNADATPTDATAAEVTSADATSADATSADATPRDATAADATPADAMSWDATGADTAPVDAVPPDATDATATDASVDADGPPTPDGGGKLVVGGNIQLIGSGPDSCTNQIPATGDRWCGFAKPAAVLGNVELWVIDVTKVAANVSVRCDGTDASCLRLSTSLYSDQDKALRVHGFDGDTLQYSELPTSGAGIFTGFVSAWRPGWTGGRRLTTSAGVLCNGHVASRAAICFENLALDVAGNETAELHAGSLDAQGDGPLPLVDTIFVQAPSDATGVQKWRVTLSPDGAKLAWSTRATASGSENLKVQALADATTRQAVATDVSQWIITGDAAEWLWLSGYNYDQNGAPSGALQSAVFPGGTGVQVIAPGVGDFNEAGSKGVFYRANVANGLGRLAAVADRDTPTSVTTLDQGVAFVFEIAKDGKHVSYTKNVQLAGTSSAPLFDLWVAGTTGATPCALAETPIAVAFPRFLSAGDMTAWARFNLLTGAVDGVYTTTSDCRTQKFASNVYSWTPIADEGYIFLDDLPSDVTVDEATLRYAKVAGGLLPATGTPIQARASLIFSALLPSLAAVAYTVNTGAATDGLYVDAALPFTPTP